MLNLTGQGENLGALGAFGADRGEPVGAVIKDVGNIGKSLDIVDIGRFAPQTFYRRERRTGSRHAALPFNRSHQRRLFTADKSTGTSLDTHFEREAHAHAILTKNAFFVADIDGFLQTFDRQWILSTAVDISKLAADRVGSDHHAFDQAIGIAVEDRTVHECTWVTFVSVTDQILLVTGGSFTERPFDTGRETATTTTTQTGLLDFLNNFFGCHGHGFFDAGETPMGEKIVEALSVDSATTGENNALLFIEELVVIFAGNLLCDRLVLEHVLFNNLRHQFSSHEIVCDGFLARHDDINQHIVGTQAPATGLFDIATFAYLTLDTLLLELGFEGIDDTLGT